MTGTVRIETCPNKIAAKRRKDALLGQSFQSVEIYSDRAILTVAVVDDDGKLVEEDPSVHAGAFVVVGMRDH